MRYKIDFLKLGQRYNSPYVKLIRSELRKGNGTLELIEDNGLEVGMASDSYSAILGLVYVPRACLIELK